MDDILYLNIDNYGEIPILIPGEELIKHIISQYDYIKQTDHTITFEEWLVSCLLTAEEYELQALILSDKSLLAEIYDKVIGKTQ